MIGLGRGVAITCTFVFTVFSCAAIVVADQMPVSVKVNKTSVQVAEPFEVTIALTVPVGTKVSFPLVTDQLGEFEVVGTEDLFDIPAQDDSDRRIWTRRLQLESLVTGELTIPGLEIQTKLGSATELVRTEEARIQVVSVLENRADPMQIRDIKSVQDIELPPPRSYAWIGWILGGVGGVFAFSLFVAAIAKRKKWSTAKQWAIGELGAIRLEGQGADDPGGVFSKLELTIRSYLESYLEFPATKQTSDEVLSSVTAMVADPSLVSRLSKLFRTAEEVKYAGQDCRVEELKAAIVEAMGLIEAFDSAELETSTPAPSAEVI